jgi:hypothetical protein
VGLNIGNATASKTVELNSSETKRVPFESATDGLSPGIYNVTTSAVSASVTGEVTLSVDVGGNGEPATDTDDDDLYEDIDGDGAFDTFDVQALFNNLNSDAAELILSDKNPCGFLPASIEPRYRCVRATRHRTVVRFFVALCHSYVPVSVFTYFCPAVSIQGRSISTTTKTPRRWPSSTYRACSTCSIRHGRRSVCAAGHRLPQTVPPDGVSGVARLPGPVGRPIIS